MKALVTGWLIILFAGITWLFWHNEWVYSLPTPVPQGYKAVKTGSVLAVPAICRTGAPRPVFLHFFNPDCACSRFNIPHFTSLVKQYGSQVDFAIVLMSNKNYSVQQIQDKFDARIPVLFDTTIAAACGVYSTPQAVIINTDRSLYYRGNYNKSRYCADKKSEYAKMALDSLLYNHPQPAFSQFAIKAYGCSLPKCTDNGNSSK